MRISIWLKRHGVVCVLTLLFLLEGVCTYLFIRSDSTLTKLVLRETLKSHWPIYAIFAFKLLAAYALFGLVILGIYRQFKLKSQWPLILCSAFYILLYNATLNPHIFDEFRSLYPFVNWLNRHSRVFYLELLSGLYVLWLIKTVWSRKLEFSKTERGGCALVILALTLYFFYLQIPHEAHIPSAKANTQDPNRPNVIIIDVRTLPKIKDPVVERFLAQGLRFTRAISPSVQSSVMRSSLFLGQIPPVSGYRENFQFFGPEQITQLNNSTLVSKLKKQGYRTVWAYNENLDPFFMQAELFEETIAPRPSLKNYVLPSLLRSRLFWAFFNNDIGYSLIPEIRANCAFSATYRPSSFTQDILNRLSNLALGHQPFLFTIHIGSPHLESELVPSKTLVSVLKYLEHSGLMENSTVVLLSDGEKLANSTTRSAAATTSLIGSAHSSQMVLDVHLPGLHAKKIQPAFGIADLLPKILNFSWTLTSGGKDVPEPVYSETGTWVQPQFSSQIFLFGKGGWSNLLTVGDYPYVISLSPEKIDTAIYQKQRAVYWNNFRLTVYPTTQGYRLFLCNQAIDPKCLKNQIFQNVFFTHRLLESLLAQSLPDQEKKLLPKLRWRKNFNLLEWDKDEVDGDESAKLPIEFNQYLLFQAANERINIDHQFKKGLSDFLRLAQNEKVKPWIALASVEATFEMCDKELIQASDLPKSFLKTKWIHQLGSSRSDLRKAKALRLQVRCLERNGKQEALSKLGQKIKAPINSKFRPKIEDFVHLARKGTTSNTELDSIFLNLKKEPRFPSFEVRAQTALLEGHFQNLSSPTVKDFETFVAQLDLLYDFQKEYGLISELDVYYDTIWRAANRLNNPTYLKQLKAEQRANELPAKYLNRHFENHL